MLPDALGATLRDADVLLVVPPFAGIDRPSLGVHLLQACARRAGFNVRVLYANLLLAREIGEAAYVALSHPTAGDLVGERFFAEAAYGIDVLARAAGADARGADAGRAAERGASLYPEHLRALAACVPGWLEALVTAVCRHTFLAVGCSTTFEQTAASIALLTRVKTRRPDMLTIIGGANCEGEMAQGIRSLSPHVDYVFSGESEATFPAFLAAARAGQPPATPIIAGRPCVTMDDLPTPDFSQYYEQLSAFLPDSALMRDGVIWLPYESSRGCWWGQKHHCTFCGLNGTGIAFRAKSPDRVLTELRALTRQHPTNLICMADNIMPHSYFRTLFPRMRQELPDVHIFYEQKANLSLEKMLVLQQAGTTVIQPGIEALSTPLLTLMDKGVSAGQNIALLRYARSVGIFLNWNLLWGFPGDLVEWYRETLELLPLLAHVNPPSGLAHLSIDRFSPYFERPEEYGIANIRPLDSYARVLPAHADIARVAYHFVGDYESGSRRHPEVVEALTAGVERWRACWREREAAPPVLTVTQLDDEVFLLTDTRHLPGTRQFQFIGPGQAMAALTGASPWDGAGEPGNGVAWALENRVCAVVDGRVVPLATAEPELLSHFESLARTVPSRSHTA